MAKPVEIYEKALKVISNCTDLKYMPRINRYVILADRQILKRKTAKNYEYAAELFKFLQWKHQDLINQKVLNI